MVVQVTLSESVEQAEVGEKNRRHGVAVQGGEVVGFEEGVDGHLPVGGALQDAGLSKDEVKVLKDEMRKQIERNVKKLAADMVDDYAKRYTDLRYAGANNEEALRAFKNAVKAFKL